MVPFHGKNTDYSTPYFTWQLPMHENSMTATSTELISKLGMLTILTVTYQFPKNIQALSKAPRPGVGKTVTETKASQATLKRKMVETAITSAVLKKVTGSAQRY